MTSSATVAAPAASPAPLLRRILLQGRYEAVTMLRNGEQLILAIVLPLLAMVGLTVTPLLDGLASSRINVAVPGILALCAMSTAFTGQGISTGFDRRYGVLRFLSTTPLGRTGLIAGKVLAVLPVLSLQVLVVTAEALVLGWQPDPPDGCPDWPSWSLAPPLSRRWACWLQARSGRKRPCPSPTCSGSSWAPWVGSSSRPNASPPLVQGHRAFPPLRRAGPGTAGAFRPAASTLLPSLSCCSGRRSPAAQQPVGSNGIEKTVSTASRPPRIASRNISGLPVTVDKTVQRLAVLSLIGQTLLIVTGGAVRLTASGLGCPTWPRCTDPSLANTPEMGIHGIIEFGNRLLTFALAAVAVTMLVYLWNLRKERRDLFLLALGLLASIPAQAVIGGITVLTQLNPWVVGLHFLVSMALVVVATLLVNRAYGRTGNSGWLNFPPCRASPVR